MYLSPSGVIGYPQVFPVAYVSVVGAGNPRNTSTEVFGKPAPSSGVPRRSHGVTGFPNAVSISQRRFHAVGGGDVDLRLRLGLCGDASVSPWISRLWPGTG